MKYGLTVQMELGMLKDVMNQNGVSSAITMQLSEIQTKSPAGEISKQLIALLASARENDKQTLDKVMNTFVLSNPFVVDLILINTNRSSEEPVMETITRVIQIKPLMDCLHDYGNSKKRDYTKGLGLFPTQDIKETIAALITIGQILISLSVNYSPIL